MNACSACKRGKRKCNRTRPSCTNCLRQDRACVYTEDFVQTQFTTNLGAGQNGICIDHAKHSGATNLCYDTGHSRCGRGPLQMTSSEAAQTHELVAASSPMTILPIGVDPFFKLPVNLGEHGLEAVHHLYRGSFHPLHAMRNCGMINRVRGTAAFYQLLAFASWHLATLREDDEKICSLKYATKASQELQKQISDPATCYTVELLLAILVFASSCAQMGDPETATIHIQGARSLIVYGGDQHPVETDTWAHAMLFWVETVACSFADVPTNYPIPTEYLTDYKRTRYQISDRIELNVVDPEVSPVFRSPAALRAINAIREVQIIIFSEAHKRDIKDDPLFASNHILPIFHDLLAMLDDQRSMLQEGFRLAAMIFLHGLQVRFFGRFPPRGFLDKLYHWNLSTELDWSSQDPVLFWILAVALTSDIATPMHKLGFMYTFRILVVGSGVTDFGDIMRRVVQISWDYGLLEAETDALREMFEQVLRMQKEEVIQNNMTTSRGSPVRKNLRFV